MFDTGDLIAGRYGVEAIARGHMGVVYLCNDQKTGIPVAIKTLKDELLDAPENRENFLREASTWIRLGSHPNIVCAFALMIVDEKPHLALERVMPNNLRGTTLKDYIFTRHIGLEEILQLGISICDGMIHALKKFPHLVHRDLKPENVLIGDDLIPKISDFGMTLQHGLLSSEYAQNSLWENSTHPAHLAQKMLGTPAVASPEQCMAEPLDERSDIYSFGCILYQLAAKRLPFYGGSVEEYIIAHTCKPVTPPIEMNRELTPELSQLITKCLEKERDKRFATFQEIHSRLVAMFQETIKRPPFTTTEERPLRAENYVDRAESFAVLQDFHHARKELAKAAPLVDNPGVIELGMGKISLQQKKYHDAIARFEKACEQMPDNPEGPYWLAKGYTETGQAEAAIRILENTMAQGSRSPSIYLFCVDLLSQKRHYRSAIRTLEKGLEECREKVALLKKLAAIQRLNHETDRELTTLYEVLKGEPADLSTHFRIAGIFQEKKDRRRVEKWMETTAKLELACFDDWHRLGELYQWLGRPQDCLNAWEQARLYRGGGSSFYVKLAKLYCRFRRYREAWNAILQAEKLGEDVDAIKREIQSKLSFS